VRRALLIGVAVILLAAAGLGLWRAATTPAPADAQAQVQRVAATLRCPTCQNLSAADSPSRVAASMRAIIGEQLGQGRTPDQVRRFFVDRYGEWILLSPPTSGLAVAVWLVPLLAVAAGGVGALRFARADTRRHDAKVDTGAMRRAEWAYDAFVAHDMAAAGSRPPGSSLVPPGDLPWASTPEGEALEAALVSLLSVRTDTPAGQPVDPRTDRRALARVAVALGEAEAAERSPDPPLPAPGGSRPDRRRLSWTASSLAFLTLAGLLLATNLAPRGAGLLVSGNLPPRTPQDAEQAIAAYRRELATDPANTQVRVSLAATLLAQDQPREAGRELAQVLRLEPDNAEALLYSGMIAARSGNADIARVALQRFLDIAPDHPAAPMARRLLAGGQQP